MIVTNIKVVWVERSRLPSGRTVEIHTEITKRGGKYFIRRAVDRRKEIPQAVEVEINVEQARAFINAIPLK